MTEEQAKSFEQYSWFVSSRNVAAYRDGEWFEVTVYDSEREAECQYDHYRALQKFAEKNK